MKKIVFFVTVMMCFISATVFARNISFNGDTFEIYLSSKKTTAVVFPNQPVSFIESTGLETDKLKIIISGNTIYFTPSDNVRATGFIEDNVDVVYPIKFITNESDDAKYDDIVNIHNRRIEQMKMKNRDTEIALIFNDLFDKKIPLNFVDVGVQKPFYKKYFKFDTLNVFDGPQDVAYIVSIANTTDHTIIAPIEYFNGKGIVAISSDIDGPFLNASGEKGDSAIYYFLIAKN